MQQQQPGTVIHSCISSLLISRGLTGPRVASRYSVRTSSYLKHSLASYQSVVTIITCHECIDVTRSGCGNPKFFRCALCAGGWIPFCEFLDPPLVPTMCQCVIVIVRVIRVPPRLIGYSLPKQSLCPVCTVNMQNHLKLTQGAHCVLH